MKFYIYILYSKSAKKFYKGQTNNVAERLVRHNTGREISTKHDAPWQLVWSIEKATRSDAIQLERKLKNLSRERLIKFMVKYPKGFADDMEKHVISSEPPTSASLLLRGFYFA